MDANLIGRTEALKSPLPDPIIPVPCGTMPEDLYHEAAITTTTITNLLGSNKRKKILDGAVIYRKEGL